MSYNNGPKIVTNGLVLCLDAGNRKSYPSSGTSWSDLSGNNNNGTLTNGPTFTGSFGGSIVFDGANDYVDIGNFTLNSSRTFMTWFKTISSDANTRRVITFPADDTSADTPAMLFGINNNMIHVGFGGAPYNGYITTGPISNNTWTCVAGSISGNTITLYINGVSFGTATNSGPVSLTCKGYIGRYNNNYGQYFNGHVSNFYLYNRALSASEVLQNFNANKGRFAL